MNILVIPEDFRKDQYILKPIICALIENVGIKQFHLNVCQNPLLGGISQAKDLDRLSEIINQYPMVDLFLLCVDRDGEEGRRIALDNLEQNLVPLLRADQTFLAENAWQELEVWVLAGHKLLDGWNWQAIRAERDPKEVYFAPLVRTRGLENTPGEGRKILSEEAAHRFTRIRQFCREDIENLFQRISQTRDVA